MKAIADWSIGEARAEIISRGDEERLEIQFDGFFFDKRTLFKQFFCDYT